MKKKNIINKVILVAGLIGGSVALASCYTAPQQTTSTVTPTTTQTTTPTQTTEPVVPTTTTTTETTTTAPAIETVVVTFLDSEGNKIEDVSINKNGKVTKEVTAPTIAGKRFDSWIIQNTTAKVDLTTYTFDSNATLVATYSDLEIPQIVFTAAEAQTEAAYVKFNNIEGVTSYNVYLDDSTSPLTDKGYYVGINNNVVRIDLFGLTAGKHKIKVAPVVGNVEKDLSASSTADLLVEAYDRSGFAHFNYTSGVGAYNDNGTLKDNAIVLYVTDENKNDVTLTYGGITVKGIGNILNSVGADNGSGKAQNGEGLPNTNQKIIQKLGEANIPLVVRFVGCVSDSGLKRKATFDASNKSLIEGLTEYDTANYGGTKGDNGHMARMKSGKNITLEGVGSDAVIDGWGFHFMAESSTEALGLGKSFEVRNLTFINTPEDAIGMEGIQASKNASSDLSASVERCWIHNNEFYGPHIDNAAESDKGEGDGSCDFKRGQYLTVSYNYFEGCHKTNLVGSADYSLQFNLSYHHNYWYMCKARGPLTRRANVHMYNNVFYGQTDYAMNTRADAYIFSEYNLFYFCKSPQAVEGGAIKSFNDSFSSYIQNKGSIGTIVTDKSAVVANNCQFSARGIKYDKFDTDPNLSYIPTNDYELQTDVTEARKVIFAKTGVAKASLIKVANVTLDDLSYVKKVISSTTVNNITVPSTVNPGKISKTIYAFKINTPTIVKVKYASDALTSTGVLCNQAGVALLTASGSIQLNPGTYFIQAMNIQPGDATKLTQGTFKEVTISSIEFEEYDSEEYNRELIANFNSLVDLIPATISYNDECYNAIKAALNAYNSLGELQSDVDATKLNNAIDVYKNLGKAYVEGLINEIVSPVTEDNSVKVLNARSALNVLQSKVSNIVISNLEKLISAEEELNVIAINVFTSRVNAIPAIADLSATDAQIVEMAENAYEILDDDQKALDSVKVLYSKLEAARARVDVLQAVASVQALIDNADTIEKYNKAVTAYNALSDEDKELVKDYKAMLVRYTIALIDEIGTPANVTSADLGKVSAARTMYDSLDEASKAQVSNYNNLTEAETILAGSVTEYTKGWSTTETLSGSTGTTKDGFEYKINGLASSLLKIKKSSNNYVKLENIGSADVVIVIEAKMTDTDKADNLVVVVTYADSSTEEKTIALAASKALSSGTITLNSKEVLSISVVGAKENTGKNVGLSSITVTYKK